MERSIRRGLSIWTGLWLLAGCQTGSEMAGIDGSGHTPVAAIGPITGFGSIFVNGTRYEIGAAQIRVNGAPAIQADLALGQIVTVAGEIEADSSSGVAQSVDFEANVRGPVESIDVADGSVTVLGQTVETSTGTIFDLGGDPPDVDSLSIGEIVEISGFVDFEGEIVATRVERSMSAELRVRGIVRNVDTNLKRFSINDLTLDYSGALVIEAFPSGQPTDGDDVTAIGQALGAGGELIVQRLSWREPPPSGEAGHEAEVEGLITRFVSAADFDVAGRAATTTATTDYEGGSAADLALNVKVQVQGQYDDRGTIVARKVEIKDGGRVY